MKSFFLSPDLWPAQSGDACELSGGEAHHLTSVLRMKKGQTARLFDGQGHEGEFVIEQTAKRSVVLRAQELRSSEPRPSRPVLALAWTKGLRRSWLLEKAVELEAAGLWFWQAERSQGKVPDDAKETWQNQLIAGAKQCANPWLPEIRTLPSGARALAETFGEFGRALLLHEDPDQGRMFSPGDMHPARQSLLILGPEGGFSPAEARLLIDAGASPVSLGARVLRWETAALACLSLYFWAGQGREDAT